MGASENTPENIPPKMPLNDRQIRNANPPTNTKHRKVSMNIQILHGENGRPQFAVISIEDLNRLAKGEIEIDEEGEIWQSIPIEAGEFDDITQPHEIVSIRIDKNVGNMAAWRIYRQMTQSEAAAQAGITQAALS